jgi:type VI secretion system secreted protein Hcp
MASDVYLQIDGVTGESNDNAHKGWIEVQSIDSGIRSYPAKTHLKPKAHHGSRRTHLFANGKLICGCRR